MDKSKLKIRAALKYGKVFWGVKNKLLYVGLFISLLFPFVTICIFLSIYLERMILLSSMYIPLIFGNSFSLIIFSVVLWRIIYNHRLLNAINLWLEDAIFIVAKVQRLDLVNVRYKPYQIEVTFDFGGKTQKRISSTGNFIIGYYKFIKEKSKKMQLLYSPKYDEILFLDD